MGFDIAQYVPVNDAALTAFDENGSSIRRKRVQHSTKEGYRSNMEQRTAGTTI